MKLLINYLQIKLFRLKPLARKRVALALLASMLIFNQSNAVNFSFGGLFSSLFSKKSTSGLIGANLVSANGAVANAAKKPFLNTKTLGLAILSVGCIVVVGYVLNFAIKRYKENKRIEEKRLAAELKEILENQNSSPEENLKNFKETLAALKKIAGSSIGKIIDDNLLLHKAARYGQTEAIRVLAGLGADINAKDIYGRTALHKAAAYGQTEKIKVLVELRADINAKDRFGDTTLHLAAKGGRTEAIKVLKELGADIEAKNENGLTALHFAAKYGQTESIRVLVGLGADIEAKISAGIDKGKTVFGIAEYKPKILELLNWAKEYDASEDKKVFMRNLKVNGVEKFVPEVLAIGQESLLSKQQHRFNLVALRVLSIESRESKKITL